MTLRTREDSTVPVYGTLDVDYSPWKETNQGKTDTTFTYTGYADYAYKRMDDVVVPDYNERIARGQIINNPCSFHREEWASDGNGSFTDVAWANPDDWATYGPGDLTMGTGGSPDYQVSFDLDGAIAEAKAKAIAHMDPSFYGFGEDLAEIRETIKFLRNPIEGLLRVSKQHKKAAKRHAVKHGITVLDALQDTYLSYRFAYTPLAKSANDAVAAWFDRSAAAEKYPERLSARGFANVTMEGSDTWTRSTGHVHSRTWSGHCRVHASILYSLRNPDLGLKRLLGLRWVDVPETIWAVMPYSFMVDRVVNISRFIRGVTNLSNPGVNVLSACVTVRTELDREIKLKSFPYSSVYEHRDVQGDSYRLHTYDFTRTPWVPGYNDTLGSPSLHNLVKDATSIADLVSLLRQRFAGK